MEVVSLGLLALASSAFLTKAKLNTKKKKEAFADSLFGEVPGRTLTTETQDFITKSATLFNPFSAMLLNKGKTSFNSNCDSQGNCTPQYLSPDNQTSVNLFRSFFTTPTSSGINTFDSNLTEKSATIYRIPRSNALATTINICENYTSNIRMGADGTADCSIFGSNNFATKCGVCHSGAVNSDGKDTAPNQGLYVGSRMTQDPSEEKLQLDQLASVNSVTAEELSRNIIKPTFGLCGSDSLTNKNYLSLNSNSCVATNNYLKCKNGQSFSNTGCYMCKYKASPSSNYFYYINSNYRDKDGNSYSERQATTFTLGGNGSITLQLYDENGSSSLGYLSPDSSNYLQTNQNSISFSLNNTPQQYTIPLRNGEAAAGKYLLITINSSTSIPYFQGNFMGYTRNEANLGSPILEKTDFAKTALDISKITAEQRIPLNNNTGDFVYYRNMADGYGLQMQPGINKERNTQEKNATFKVLIPYLYINTSNIEARYCPGPFVKNANSSNLLSNNPCFDVDAGPSNYNSKCLSNIFIAAGCSANGSNFPGNSAAIARLNSYGNLGNISSNVKLLFERSYSGYSNGGNQQMSDEAWLSDQKACFNVLTTNVNPCSNLSEVVKANGPLSDQCIQYIYRSGMNNATSNGGTNDPNTYTTYSNARSLFSNKFKDRYCTENGTISPLSGDETKLAIGRSNSSGQTRGINALKSFYDNIHMMANKPDLTNEDRAQYVLKCYGKVLDVQADSNPIEVNGEDVALTTCGRYDKVDRVTITSASGKSLILSQIVVIDARGQNVANGKTVTAINGGNEVIADRNKTIVDGTLSLKDAPYTGTINGETLSINLTGQYDIVQIIVYNTKTYNDQSKLAGATINIYKRSINGALATFTLTQAPVQYFDLSSTSPPASCPKLMNGVRGDLLKIQPSISNEIETVQAGLAAANNYTRYNLSIAQYGTGINAAGATTTSPVAKWIWNHPYADVNAGSTSASFYTTINNTSSNRKQYILYYNFVGSTLTIYLNNAVLTLPADGNARSMNITLIPGNNLITVTSTPSPATGPAGFAAFIKDANTNVNTKTNITNADNSDWTCYTSPSIVGAYAYSTGNYTKYDLAIDYYGTGINATGATTTSPVANWIWNHVYASVNAGSTAVSYYAKVNNSGTTVTTNNFYYNTVNCSVVITVNKKSFTATKGAGTSVELVPGDNLIYVTCSQTSSYSPAGFAAIIGDYKTGISSWFCDTAPSVDGINTAATTTGSIYKIYDTPTGSWYDDATNTNYVNTSYGPFDNIDAAKWIWNNPEGALAAGTAAAKFYYEVTENPGADVLYYLYYKFKGTIKLKFNGKEFTDSSFGDGNNFRFFGGLNQIEITVTPSGGQAGFIAYVKNASIVNGQPTAGSVVTNSQTGIASSIWKSGVATTRSDTTPCAFVTGTNMTYNCANSKFKTAGCTRDLLASDYKATFWNKNETDTNTEIANNWAARTATSGTNQTACKGTTVCPAGKTYNSANQRCWTAPTDAKSISLTPIYNTATMNMYYSYEPDRWIRTDKYISLTQCGNLNTWCGGITTNGSAPDGNGNCQGTAGICVGSADCSIINCGIIWTRRPTGSLSLTSRYSAGCVATYGSGYKNEIYEYANDRLMCEETRPSDVNYALSGSYIRYYKACATGYTWNTNISKCEKSVTTNAPNF